MSTFTLILIWLRFLLEKGPSWEIRIICVSVILFINLQRILSLSHFLSESKEMKKQCLTFTKVFYLHKVGPIKLQL